MINQNIKDLKKILAIAKRSNLKRLKLGDIELEFGQSPVPQKIRHEEPRIVIPEDLEAGMPPDDEMLHFSTPYFDVLQNQRKEN